jgi:hypothetical protein
MLEAAVWGLIAASSLVIGSVIATPRRRDRAGCQFKRLNGEKHTVEQRSVNTSQNTSVTAVKR